MGLTHNQSMIESVRGEGIKEPPWVAGQGECLTEGQQKKSGAFPALAGLGPNVASRRLCQDMTLLLREH